MENKEISIRETALNKRGIQLSTYSQLMEFSELVMKSGLAPKSFSNKESIMIAVQFGLEVGLAPMQSLQGVAVINGMPSLYGDSAKALCLSDPSCVWIKESTRGSIENGDYTAICSSLRIGHDEPLVTEFSMDDAKRAGLWIGDNPDEKQKHSTWYKYPKRMMMFRARGFNLRDNFTDVMKGFKTFEEVSDYQEIGVTKIKTSNTQKKSRISSMDLPPSDFEDVE